MRAELSVVGRAEEDGKQVNQGKGEVCGQRVEPPGGDHARGLLLQVPVQISHEGPGGRAASEQLLNGDAHPERTGMGEPDDVSPLFESAEHIEPSHRRTAEDQRDSRLDPAIRGNWRSDCRGERRPPRAGVSFIEARHQHVGRVMLARTPGHAMALPAPFRATQH